MILNNKKLHILFCAKMLWDPYFKISCLNIAFSLVAGPQKIRTVIQKGANILLFNIFKVPAKENLAARAKQTRSAKFADFWELTS